MSRKNQRGVGTAEFAGGLLAGAIVLIFVCWGLGLGITQLRAMDAAAQLARQEARGNHAPVGVVREHDPKAQIEIRKRADKVTVTVALPAPAFGPFLPERMASASATADLEPGER